MNTFYEHREEDFFIGEMTHYPFPLHIHSSAELLIITAGGTVLTIDGIRYELRPGDAAVIFPLVPHGYESVTPDVRGIVAIFPPDLIPEYAATFHSLLPENPLLPASSAGGDEKAALTRLEELDMQNHLPLCVAYLHVLLADVLHRLSFRPAYDYAEKNLGQRIMRYLSEHACDDITLESAARALGISSSHLSHFFSEKLQTSFRRFINSTRIVKARLLMRNPALTLTEISDMCGYSNMRTFRRAFLREVGRLPSEQMQLLRNRMPADETAFPDS